jgi:hypothetical protein
MKACGSSHAIAVFSLGRLVNLLMNAMIGNRIGDEEFTDRS